MAQGSVAHLPRGGARRRQDLCDAERGSPRASSAGSDVVVGYVETHGRPQTAEQIDGLEVVPRRPVEYRGATFEEMDVDAILARKPAQALVDELAHTNVLRVPAIRSDGRTSRSCSTRGIDVISTLNIQHLESLNDVVERITGVKQRETIPDAVVRQADAIELVDMSPEALRRRMAHGNIYKPERIDASLTNYFRPGNLAALRELALLWVADRVDEALGRVPRTARDHRALGNTGTRPRRDHRRAGNRSA